MSEKPSDIWYPTVDDVVLIHESILEDDPKAEPGIENRDRIQFAIDYIQEGHYGEIPESIHDKAFHLMRLIASNHWFADGNKRTALGTTSLFYALNGLDLDVGRDIKALLTLFAVKEEIVDRDAGVELLMERTRELPPEELLKDISTYEMLAIVLVMAGKKLAEENVEFGDHND